MTNDIPDKVRNEINEAIFSGKKIAAIKLYRDATGAELDEAKSYIDQLTNQLRQEAPYNFKTAKGSGCATKALVLLFITGFFLYFLL